MVSAGCKTCKGWVVFHNRSGWIHTHELKVSRELKEPRLRTRSGWCFWSRFTEILRVQLKSHCCWNHVSVSSDHSDPRLASSQPSVILYTLLHSTWIKALMKIMIGPKSNIYSVLTIAIYIKGQLTRVRIHDEGTEEEEDQDRSCGYPEHV